MKGAKLVSLLLDVETPDGTCRVQWTPDTEQAHSTWAEIWTQPKRTAAHGVCVTVFDGPTTHAATAAVAAVTQKIVPAARMLGVL